MLDQNRLTSAFLVLIHGLLVRMEILMIFSGSKIYTGTFFSNKLNNK